MKNKSTLFIVLSLGVLAIGVGAYFAVLWMWGGSPGEAPAAPEVTQVGELDRTPVHTAYGTVTSKGAENISISVIIDGKAEIFSFTYDNETKFSSFAFKDANDLVGSKTPFEASGLKIGDTIVVYADEEIGSVSPQMLTEVVKQ